ncbi:ABC transporter permease [Sanguibacter massiliensis]|uniref:ABC transporter permease n=1 Tax=Sanguibacter massiliensis TaxID=1973217 RepID=UPI000C8329F7|nr:ABC transporter permease [Sanguibacter massiliensis]
MSALLAHAPVPFLRVWSAENRKVVNTRAGAVFLGLIALAVVGMSVVMAIWPGDSELTFGLLVNGSASMGLAMFMPILAILAVTSEFSQRTLAVTFALEPRRGRVVAGKIAAALTTTAVLLVVAVAVAAVVLLGAAAVRGETAVWDIEGGVFVGTLLTLVLVVLQGTAFGLLLRSTPLAIITYLILPSVFGFVTMFISPIRDALPWFELSNATVPLIEGLALTGTQWAQLASASFLWIAVPGGIGVWRLLKGDL